jgi:hypothetical protein
LLLAADLGRAEERRLAAAEIEARLSGNTAISVGGGTAYRQYFDPSGATTYVSEGGPPSPGKWRADAAEDHYCSYWEPTGWDCYEVYSEGPDSVIWVAAGSGTRYPARIVEGDQL